MRTHPHSPLQRKTDFDTINEKISNVCARLLHSVLEIGGLYL